MRERAASFARRSTSRKVRLRRTAPISKLLFDGLPEPIDLELDLKNRFLYWTDRGDPPRGNTVNRAPLDADFNKRPAPEILLTHLMEGIGIALDFKGNRMFLTDLAGSIYSRQARRIGKETSSSSRREISPASLTQKSRNYQPSTITINYYVI